jgi:predicted phosphodiesterase
LKPGTLYEYTVFSQQEDKSGNLSKPVSLGTNVHGKKLTFRTNDHSKEAISWLMVTDIHYNHYIEKNFEKHITPERLVGRDFIAFNGDMVTTMASEKSHFDKLFTNLHSILATNNTPFYYVRGNHESRGNFAQKYMDYYPTWTGMPYYAFRQGPVFFIVLDGGEDKPDSYIEYYGTAAFDLYRQAEGEWLQTVLDSEEFKSAPYRVILSHIPLNDNSWHGGRHAWKHLCQRCEDKGINIMISGHIHKYKFYDKGVHNKSFPTVVIGADKFVDATADKEKMVIAIKNSDGSVHKEFTFPSAK